MLLHINIIIHRNCEFWLLSSKDIGFVVLMPNKEVAIEEEQQTDASLNRLLCILKELGIFKKAYQNEHFHSDRHSYCVSETAWHRRKYQGCVSHANACVLFLDE